MEQTVKAIEAAYAKQVGDIYRTFAQALLGAGSDSDEIAEAEAKFRKSLAFANDVRVRALGQVG